MSKLHDEIWGKRVRIKATGKTGTAQTREVDLVNGVVTYSVNCTNRIHLVDPENLPDDFDMGKWMDEHSPRLEVYRGLLAEELEVLQE